MIIIEQNLTDYCDNSFNVVAKQRGNEIIINQTYMGMATMCTCGYKFRAMILVPTGTYNIKIYHNRFIHEENVIVAPSKTDLSEEIVLEIAKQGDIFTKRELNWCKLNVDDLFVKEWDEGTDSWIIRAEAKGRHVEFFIRDKPLAGIPDKSGLIKSYPLPKCYWPNRKADYSITQVKDILINSAMVNEISEKCNMDLRSITENKLVFNPDYGAIWKIEIETPEKKFTGGFRESGKEIFATCWDNKLGRKIAEQKELIG
jgi:hypothetical protein